MRSDSSFSASRSGRPKFCWSNVFLNSGPTGSGSSSATMPMRRLERVAGADRAREQVERLGKLLLEPLQPAASGGASASQRQRSRRAARRSAQRYGLRDEHGRDAGPRRAADDQRHEHQHRSASSARPTARSAAPARRRPRVLRRARSSAGSGPSTRASTTVASAVSSGVAVSARRRAAG